MKSGVMVLILLLAISSPLLAGRTVYVEGVDGYTGCEDTYMIDYRIEENYGDAIYIECQSEDGREGGSRMKPLIRFTNLGLAGYTVQACTLQLYCYLWIGRDQEIQLHEVLRAWGEFQTTCIDYQSGSQWAGYACGVNDIDARSSYVCSIVDSAGTGYKSFPLPASLVQKWVDAPGDRNNGLLFRSPQHGFIKDRSFRSSDMFVSSLRPRLIVHYDSCATGVEDYPMLRSVEDVPEDAGGVVRLTWSRCSYDGPASELPIKRYKIWRKRREITPPLVGSILGAQGEPIKVKPTQADDDISAWEMIGRVRATGACEYSFEAATHCDSSAAGTCWNRFYVSACTGPFGRHFDSPVMSGYSVNNSPQNPNQHGSGTDGDGSDSGKEMPAFLSIQGANPGNGGFALSFGIARPDYVRLRVYDVSGRVVATLMDSHADSGPHSLRWDCLRHDGAEVPPGIYILNLLTSTESRSEKLVLVR
jgi:hypothetical protein